MDYASRLMRFFAAVIDVVVLAVVMAILGAAGIVDALPGGRAGDASAVGNIVQAIVGFGYYVALTSAFGATLGKMALGMRVTDADGKRPGFGAVVMREVVGKIVSALVILIGFFWILVDDRRQGWHDKIGGTFVVKAR